MKQPRKAIAAYIAEKTLEEVPTNKFINEVAAYLLEERRVSELNSIIRDVQSDWAKAGRLEVIATSAFPLADAIKTDIIKQLKEVFPDAKTIKLSEEIDPKVIGGVRLTMAEQQLDLTLESKLNKFKSLTHAGKDN
jgi:F0F1-type ATP synthase delta subunit